MSNIYQMIKSHFTFIYNIVKRYINILYFIIFYILYKIICIVLKKKYQKSRTENTRYDIA